MSDVRQFKLKIRVRRPYQDEVQTEEHTLLSSGVPTPSVTPQFVQWYTPSLHLSYSASIVVSWTLEEEAPEGE